MLYHASLIKVICYICTYSYFILILYRHTEANQTQCGHLCRRNQCSEAINLKADECSILRIRKHMKIYKRFGSRNGRGRIRPRLSLSDWRATEEFSIDRTNLE